MRAAVKRGDRRRLRADPEAAGGPPQLELRSRRRSRTLILYLASDESRYVNGEEITIDGGLCTSQLTPPRARAASGSLPESSRALTANAAAW